MFTIAKQFTLSKTERLKSRKLIQELFSKGKVFSVFPLRIVYIQPEGQMKLQAGFSVSTRNFKKAVDRNRIKRLMREAYRLQKHILNERPLAVFFIYTGKELPDYNIIYDKMKLAIESLIKKTNERAS